MDENRKKALAAALGQIEKQFGKGSVMRMGDGAGIVMWKLFPLVPSAWISPWVLVGCPKAG